MDSIRRPSANDSEEDLLRMQEEFFRQQKKPSVNIQKVQKSAVRSASDQKAAKFVTGGRFALNLETLQEESTGGVLFGIQERNFESLTVEVPELDSELFVYGKDEGFPKVLDLSAYFKNPQKKFKAKGLSMFATEFDRTNGHIEEIVPSCSIALEESENGAPTFATENMQRIAAMSPAEIVAAQREIQERFDPKLIEFIKNRNKTQAQQPKKDENPAKMSKFKKERLGQVDDEPKEERKEDDSLQADMIKGLEVLDEFADWKDNEKYNRLAADVVHLDLMSKYARRILPRQTQQAVKLFDALKFEPNDYKPDALLDMARSKLDDIKQMFLEEIKSGDQVIFQFARGLNPVVDTSWMLRPVRAVLDAVQLSERTPTPDDVDLVRLSLLWSTLLFCERPTLFYTLVDVNDFFVRIAEVYILGPEVFADETVNLCVERLFEKYLLPSAEKGLLQLRLDQPIAGLDAFMPFYEELLRKFEEFSAGHPQFMKIVLLASYGNSITRDALECQTTLWSARRFVVREATATAAQLTSLIRLIKKWSVANAQAYEEVHYVVYSTLLSSYAGAINSRRITRERNPGVFAIAANELGCFVQRHTTGSQRSAANLKNFDALVAVVRVAVEDVLTL